MKKENVFDKVKRITYLTPASTVVLVSTRSCNGINNVAPFGMFMMASSSPPMVLIGVTPVADTHKNILETREFVVSIPKLSIVNELYAAGEKFPPEIDEFTRINLTPYDSNLIKAPKIVECIVNLECKYTWSQVSGDHTIFCGTVVDADIDDGIFSSEISSIELRRRVSEIYHVSSNAFMSINKDVIFADNN